MLAAAMLIAGPPVAKTLPTAPGMARIETDLEMLTVPELKLAESSIQISPPSCTAASAAGSNRHGRAREHGLESLPVDSRYARKSAWEGVDSRSAARKAAAPRSAFRMAIPFIVLLEVGRCC